MKNLSIIAIMTIILLSAGSARADGTYFIDEDENGIYMSTDQDGSWYIHPDDASAFQIGETGNYQIGNDRNGTYIKTGRHRKFYIDMVLKESLDHQISEYNRQQERQAETATEVIVKGNQVLVPVVLGYRGKEIETFLLLDTGASMTTLYSEIADELDFDQTKRSEIMVAGGNIIRTEIAKLTYLEVGPHRKENLHVGIIEHNGPSVQYRGLLGMDFLRNLAYRIDFKKQILEWEIN